MHLKDTGDQDLRIDRFGNWTEEPGIFEEEIREREKAYSYAMFEKSRKNLQKVIVKDRETLLQKQ